MTRSDRIARERAPRADSVLIVDDNQDLRELYAAYFEAAGFRVATATDGVTGFAEAVTGHPDVIVTDLSMPHVDGWEMTRRLKSDPRTRHVPIIACTGRVLGSSAERALEAGCDAYVIKPFLPDDLLREARRALARHTRRRSA
jgi:two-component system, cell cycle response regulator DivK